MLFVEAPYLRNCARWPLTDYIYTDIYCKLSKCIGQTSCSYEHYLVSYSFYYTKMFDLIAAVLILILSSFF